MLQTNLLLRVHPCSNAFTFVLPPNFPSLQPHLESLRKYTYGKHIVNKVEALLAAQAQAEAGPTAAAEPGAPMPLPLPLAVAAEQ